MEKLFEYTDEQYSSLEFQNFCEWSPKKTKNITSLEDDFHMFRVEEFYKEEWKRIRTDLTKEVFEEKLLDQFWNVNMSRHTIVIEKNEEKIRIKFYHYYKTRGAGRRFYKLVTGVKFFSYNFVKNAMYEGSVNNYHKKRKFSKSMRRIGPNMNPLNSIRSYINNTLSNELKKTNYLTENMFVERVNDIYNIFLNSIPGIENYKNITNPDYRFYKLYYDKQGVKLPDNWSTFIFSFPQPKLRIIRKHKSKYIDALMSVHELKGDKIRKTLHKVSSFNPKNFKTAVSLFGEGFILQQSDEFIFKLFESSSYIDALQIIIPQKEKKNVFEIFKLVIDELINPSSFYDHFRFYNSISRFEKIKWVSKDIESFRQEHLDWTERHDFYTRGDYTRIYDDKFVHYSQEPIKDAENETYYPVLLRTSKEYNEESFTQSNCVKTYIQKPSSVIISLRKGSKESKERATIEFNIIMIDDKIYLNRVQTLGRFNQRLPDSWNVPIGLLDNRIRTSMTNFDYELPKMMSKFGHKSFVSKGIFKKHKSFVAVITTEGRKIDNTLYLYWDKDINLHNHELTPYLNYDDII